jgi:4-diphosphocytidyl-2C-methyl-D-erythritol kinase
MDSLFFPVLQSSKIQAAQQAGYAQGANVVSQQAMQSFSGNVFQNGYAKAYGEIGQALVAQYNDGCKQAIPLNVGGSGAIGIVSIDCLAQAQSGATQTPAAPARGAPAKR